VSRDITIRTRQSIKDKAQEARRRGKSVNKQPKPLKLLKPTKNYKEK
jgi:hypothetical protein